MPDNANGAQKVSIIFRALNEEKWFGDALQACRDQILGDFTLEIILVDSGSVDATVDIARSYDARIVHIKKSEFTFGRSLNLGCDAATGDYLVFISAHCIPAHENWLANLVAPLRDARADYVYGRQIGHEISKYSERQVFAQYFGTADKIPQDELFCNNANAAIRKSLWERYKFDETVTGLEDLVLAKKLAEDGQKLGYCANAPVIHIHEESFSQIRRRYYREALTLREIFPEVHYNFGDFLRYFSAGVFHDFAEALSERRFFRTAPEIIAFRLMQYWGAYLGHNEHRELSRAQKERYYYPRKYDARERKEKNGSAGRQEFGARPEKRQALD